jgi:hypothetical protein
MVQWQAVHHFAVRKQLSDLIVLSGSSPLDTERYAAGERITFIGHLVPLSVAILPI